MSIADLKKGENIIEYILYMWNMEQLHRVLKFDDQAIVTYITKAVDDDSDLKKELSFHRQLSQKMRSENIEKEGHLSELDEIMVELHYLHSTLLNMTKDESYETAFKESQAYLQEFKEKTNGKVRNDIEAMLTAIFGFLTLKMSKQDVSTATQEAINSFSQVLGLLASKYNLMKQGHLNFNLN